MFHQDISTPLWSAKPIEDDPEVIIAAHLAFLRAGADIILTSTCVSQFRDQLGPPKWSLMSSAHGALQVPMRVRYFRALRVLA